MIWADTVDHSYSNASQCGQRELLLTTASAISWFTRVHVSMRPTMSVVLTPSVRLICSNRIQKRLPISSYERVKQVAYTADLYLRRGNLSIT